ncbi:MAG: aminoacyl--tRNA ligase-related protein [Candidatus Paceibacterota bacterium]
MFQSRYLSFARKEAPKDEETKNAQLLVRAGFVDKLMAGVYSYLPLGLRVLRNIETVVREEMNELGAHEILMPMLHPKSIWETTGGWSSIDVLFKIQSRTEKEYALGQSEEEVVTPLLMSRVNTYKDLPVAVYQIHWKFRDELRAKSGLLRGREFLMKDMYSFHENQDDFEKFYMRAKESYLKIFNRLGLVAKVTEASGGSFSQKISYEFMVLTDAGEDDILYCPSCDFCVNVEITKQKEGELCPKCSEVLQQARASEVGNVFDLGQKYGKDFNLGFIDHENKKQYPIMGCYGIGISRLMGVIAETRHDEKGLIWPKNIAPFRVHIIALVGQDDAQNKIIMEQTIRLHDNLQAEGIEVLCDDRMHVSPGQKFAESDLMGIPYRLVISQKTGDKIEVKKRNEQEINMVDFSEIIQYVS